MTATQEIEDSKRCPFCGSNINLNKLGRLGFSTEELEIVAQHAKDGTLKNMLTVAQIAWQSLDPEKTTSKFQVGDAISKLREASNQGLKTFIQETKDFIERLCAESDGDKLHIVKEYEEKSKSMLESFQKEIAQSTKTIEKLEQANQKQYSEFRDDLREIREKIVGTGIGNVSEMVTIRDLKELVHTDSFSEARASKGGTDIVATVKEKGTICGVITISNKCTQKWEGNFLSQLTRDMKDDGSRFGILVTKAFPREALSSKAYPVDVDDGRTIILVKPEYASLAYFGMREAATHWFEARNALKRKEDEVEESARTFRALVTWINGDEFEETIGHIASARNAVEDTRRQLNSMRSYINTQLDKTTKFQESVDQSLIHIKTLVTRLRDLLKGGSSDPF